jgi:hypothetical protein
MGGKCSKHGKKRDAFNVFVRKPERRDKLEDSGIDGKIISECILRN